MSQHDYVLANQPGASFRADLNNLAAALGSTNLGGTAPPLTFAGMQWIDSTNHQWKIRDEANTVWVTLGTFQGTQANLDLLARALTAGITGNSGSGISLASRTAGGGSVVLYNQAGGTGDFRVSFNSADRFWVDASFIANALSFAASSRFILGGLHRLRPVDSNIVDLTNNAENALTVFRALKFDIAALYRLRDDGSGVVGLVNAAESAYVPLNANTLRALGGIVYLNSGLTRYLQFDGTQYQLPSSELFVNGTKVIRQGTVQGGSAWTFQATLSGFGPHTIASSYGDGIYIFTVSGGGQFSGAIYSGGEASVSVAALGGKAVSTVSNDQGTSMNVYKFTFTLS